MACASRTPSSTWPSKRMRSATRKVGGLPTSCSSAPQRQRGGGLLQLVQQQQRVHPDIAFGVKFGRLLDAFHGCHSGRMSCQQAGFVEQLEAAPRAALGEDARQFVAHPLGRDLFESER